MKYHVEHDGSLASLASRQECIEVTGDNFRDTYRCRRARAEGLLFPPPESACYHSESEILYLGYRNTFQTQNRVRVAPIATTMDRKKTVYMTSFPRVITAMQSR